MSLPVLATANANFVTDFLAVGGDLSYDDIALEQTVDLVRAGITHILDVRQEANDASWWSSIREVEYHWAGIDDAGQRVPATWFESVTTWAVGAIESGGAVLTHCHMGINRGPSAGFAVLLRLGWDPVEALDAIRSARPIAHIWYAEDALHWHLGRTGATSGERTETLTRLAAWRDQNPLDVVRIIRSIRVQEAS